MNDMMTLAAFAARAGGMVFENGTVFAPGCHWFSCKFDPSRGFLWFLGGLN